MKIRKGQPLMEEELYERRAAICKAFANPVRLKILDLVGKKAYPVSELRRRLGVSEANLSQHLTVLKSAGIIETSRTGKRVYCYVAIPEVKQACSLVCDVLRAQFRSGRRLSI
ncbi:MAG: metalloregulator ArsR/SmtB family transcription factor [Candidatus Sulfotelmatobacter sp.]